MIPEFKQTLKNGAKALNIKLSDHHIHLLEGHADQLMLWNKKINLTAINTAQEIAEKHFIDSLSASLHTPVAGTLIDLGSGGGFPGLPLKIMDPHLSVILVDASRKKVNFLKYVIRTLGLENIKAVHERAENLHGEPAYAGQFDCVISRAFTELGNFVDLSEPFLNPNGVICAMKGKHVDREIVPAVSKRFSIEKHYYQLPFEKSDRNIILLSKK